MAFTTGEAGSVNALSGDVAFSVILALLGSIKDLIENGKSKIDNVEQFLFHLLFFG